MIVSSRKTVKAGYRRMMIGALMASFTASGCITGTEKNAAEKDIFETTTEKVVVQRIDSKDPILSPFGKNHWMDARGATAVSIKRIHALLATGESLPAERDARKYLVMHPGDVEGLTALSSALAQSGQYDLAAYYAKLVAAKLPDNPHSLNIQGLAILIGATRIDEFRRAESLFQRAFDGSESEVAAGLNLGDLYLELGNSDSAAKIFSTARTRCHNCIPALMGFGIASRRTGRYSDALEAFNKVVSANKLEVEALYHIALVYRDGLNDRKKAEETLRTLIATNTERASVKERAYTVLRAMLSETPHADTAIAESDAKKSDPTEGEATQSDEPTLTLDAADSDFGTVSSADKSPDKNAAEAVDSDDGTFSTGFDKEKDDGAL
jgi:tetratricopeptide (TPR) repeat protein